MFTARSRQRLAGVALAAGALVALSACSSGDPISNSSGSSDAADTIVVGSQAYYSNEIIAEIYAQALEANGFTVERKFNIGQREAYMPAIEAGEVDLFPEYTGNLLRYFDEESTAKTADEVYDALTAALPADLAVLEQSPATDQDSYNVTAEFASANNVSSLEDLAGLTVPLTLGGAAELATRDYGPTGLEALYGVKVAFKDIASPALVVAELQNGGVQLANVYSADPSIGLNNLVTLEDPKGLFLPSHVVPLVNKDANTSALAEVINKVSAAMTPDDLIEMNIKSQEDKASADDLAAEWLKERKLV